MRVHQRLLQLPQGSFFLFGPRGTGKSTWLRQVLPEALYLDLLQPDHYRELKARPERLRELVAAQPPERAVVLDEIQRIPELLPLVHALIERDRGRRFALTGSSARKLRRGGVDLLAGRAVRETLHPFMAAELPDFDFERALSIGLLPLVVAAAEPRKVLDAYANLYLDEEIRFEGFARDVGDFARFLEAVSFSHASVLNVAEVARECEVQRRTVASYVEVLEDLLLAFRLPVFARRAQRKTTAHPKLYLFDCGVFRTLRPSGPLDRREEIHGAAFEGLVAQHLRAWIAYSGFDGRLSFWRTPKGNEVDFVVYGGGGFWALEVKNSKRIRPRDLSGLKAFAGDYPECTAALLYRGTERLLIDGIQCLPGEEFLRRLHPSRPLLDSPPPATRRSVGE